MRAHVLTIDNPFAPASRQLVEVRRGRSIRSLAPRTDAPYIAVLNGKPMLRAGWRRKLRDGDKLAFAVLPRGGGGGGSNPLRALLMIALVAFAGPLASTLLGADLAGTLAFGTMTWGKLAALGIVMAGTALINAVLPQQGTSGANIPAPSPTYSMGAQGNTARIGQPIPVQYGRLRRYPEFAAQPYSEYSGNDQYLFQLFCLGQGEYAIEDIYIEDTPLSSFPEITYEVVPPGAALTLFPADVSTSVEVSGQELMPMVAATYSQSGTTITVTETAHGRVPGDVVALDFTSGTAVDAVLSIATTPTADTFTVTAASGLTTSGNVNVRTVLGGTTGYVASAAATTALTLAIDVILPRGLYGLSGATLTDQTMTWTVQARRIDDSGTPLGSWITLGDETITDRTSTPIRKSYRYTLATPGRYAVRAWRTSAANPDDAAGDDLLWGALRSYLKETSDFGSVTLVAMRMLATNSLSSLTSRKIAVLCTRKLPIWNGTSWSAPTATSSIAWALADAARNSAYGPGFADAKIDLATLLALDAVWTAREDEFNGIFESEVSWWDAATAILGAGRARPYMQGGMLRVVRDAEATVPVALYSMRNIKQGSFSVDYMMTSDDTADAVDVTYFDATIWQQRMVRAKLAGSAAARPVKLDLSVGVTSRDQALREGLYHAAANKYRRRFMSFTTEMEGFIPSVGDLIAVQHDMPGWGAQAEVVDWTAPVLTLSEDMTFGAGTYYIGLRRVDGSLSGPWEVIAGSKANQVVLKTAIDMVPYAGSDHERTHVVFGKANTWRTLAKVVTAKPKGMHEVTIEAVADDPSVYTADTGVTAPPLNTSSLSRKVTRPVVAGLIARKVPNDATRVLVAWRPAPNADIYQIEMAEGSDPTGSAVSWTRVGDTTAAQYHLTLMYAARTMVRVRGVGLTEGPWVAAALGTLIPNFWNTDLTPFWTLDTNAMWSS